MDAAIKQGFVQKKTLDYITDQIDGIPHKSVGGWGSCCCCSSSSCSSSSSSSSIEPCVIHGGRQSSSNSSKEQPSELSGQESTFNILETQTLFCF